ncbi:hypothetical protein T11_9413 [Trichinella zimbabwensis]|uniref:Uncharacterized protein n=1 Tax=Trichinella zimbabwensis TaxID=268475 RepID=A0A0V1HF81_9BILA|nr:hypothetical protein T11_7072 [Trichinella zimbabwensis]KRZ08944.1 hypothetical protein T11_9413 [Trichinella zimbabwensis]
MNTHDLLPFQVFGVVITLAATTALLMLCGWCKKKKHDGQQSASSTDKVETCVPSAPDNPDECQTVKDIPMVIPDYNAAKPIPTPASAPSVVCPPSEDLTFTTETPTKAVPAAPVAANKVDLKMESWAQGQSAMETLAEVPSITSNYQFQTKVNHNRITKAPRRN